MQLFLIRHAESENNAKPIYRRVEDPPLTAVGRLQAEHLGDWVQTLKFDVLITSPVLRALQTTRRIFDRTGQHVQVWDNVFEEGGIYRGHGPDATEGGPGLSREKVIEHVTGAAGDCTLDPSIGDRGWWGRHRESSEEAVARATEVVGRLAATFGREKRIVVAVIHADFKRKMLNELVGDELDPRLFGALRNTGITKLDLEQG
ncbi:MAG: histidine phosphatase family protein, partial [Rubripirellula sp.]